MRSELFKELWKQNIIILMAFILGRGREGIGGANKHLSMCMSDSGKFYREMKQSKGHGKDWWSYVGGIFIKWSGKTWKKW